MENINCHENFCFVKHKLFELEKEKYEIGQFCCVLSEEHDLLEDRVKALEFKAGIIDNQAELSKPNDKIDQ